MPLAWLLCGETTAATPSQNSALLTCGASCFWRGRTGDLRSDKITQLVEVHMAGRREREDHLAKRLLPLFVLARIAKQVSRLDLLPCDLKHAVDDCKVQRVASGLRVPTG